MGKRMSDDARELYMERRATDRERRAIIRAERAGKRAEQLTGARAYAATMARGY